MNMDKPNSVNNAVKFLYCAMTMLIISSIVHELLVPSAELEDLIDVVLFFIIVSIMCIVLFYTIYMIGKGRNWARLTWLTLFIIMHILYVWLIEDYVMFLIEIVEEFPFWVGKFTLLLSIGVYMLFIVALVFLFQKPSSDWFRNKKEQLRKIDLEN